MSRRTPSQTPSATGRERHRTFPPEGARLDPTVSSVTHRRHRRLRHDEIGLQPGEQGPVYRVERSFLQ